MKNVYALLCALLMGISSYASHVFGGEMYYDWTGNGSQYKVTLVLYRDCSGIALGATQTINACAGNGSGNNVNGVLNRVSQSVLPSEYFLNPCQSPCGSNSCVEKHVYEGVIDFPHGQGGYMLYWETCCRSGSVSNLQTPGSLSAIYYCFLPDPVDPSVGFPNSSARFREDPPPNLCANDSINYNHSAFEPDGIDSISYLFENPKGVSGSHNACPPFPNSPFVNPYNKNYPIPSNPAFAVDPVTGRLIGGTTSGGLFVYSIRYNEWRNGVPISYGVRDYVFNITNCCPVVPTADFEPQDPDTTYGYCGSLGVQFSNTSLNSVTYLWDFGDTLTTTDTSSLEEPYYQYDRPGIYTVMLISGPGYFCADTTYQVYQVFPGVVADFAVPDTQCLTDNSYDFYPLDHDTSNSVKWDFGPDAIPRFVNIDSANGIEFQRPGDHMVELIIYNETCSDTIVKSVNVAPQLNAFYQAPGPACITNQNLDFEAVGNYGPFAKFLWVFGDSASVDSVETEDVLGVTFNNSDYHVVTLTVQDSGCSFTYVDSVLIVDEPTASFAPEPEQCLGGNNFDFTNTGVYDTAATFIWTFGPDANRDSSFAENPNNIEYSTSGTHLVTLTVDVYGCTDTYIDSVKITDAPVAALDQLPNTCVDNATFSFQASAQSGIYYEPSANFFWNFGNGAVPSSANTENVTNVQFSQGTHSVVLTISDNGCTDRDTMTFTVTPKPVANFPAVADQCLSNGPFDFINTGLFGPDATFLWDFDTLANPLTSTSQDALNVMWTEPGTYTVSLTISENGCDATVSRTFTLTPSPLASFDSLGIQCIQGNSYTINNTSSYGSGATINWFFENAVPATSTDSIPTNIVFNQEGWNEVELNLTENGCTDILIDSVFISSVPQPSFTPGNAQCIDINNYNFNAAGTYGDSAKFLWNFEDGVPDTSNAENPISVSFNSIGWKTVELTISEYGCSATYVDSVEITAAPAPSFTPGPPACLNNNSYDFAGNGTYGPDASFQWVFENASPDTVNALNANGVVFNAVGFQKVWFSISENGCTYTYVDSVEITAAPVPSYLTPAPQCEVNNSFDFFASGSYDQNSASISWNFGSNAIPQVSSQENPSGVVFGNPGWHTVSLTITESGCSDVYTDSVLVTAAPVISYVAPGPECINFNSFNFTANGSYDPSATFAWDFGPNSSPANSTAENPSNVTYSTVGWHTITVTVTDNGCSDTYVDSVEVTAPPTPSYPAQATQCLNGNSYNFTNTGTHGANATFDWDFGQNAIPQSSTAENPTGVTFTSPGSHLVSFTIGENGCFITYYDTVRIAAPPVASFPAQQNQCIDVNSFDFSINGTYGNTASFNWDFGTNASPQTSNSTNPTGIVYSAPGSYPVTLSITEYGCVDTYTDTVVVVPLPVVDFGNYDEGCIPYTTQFTNNSTAFGAMTYLWDFGDGSTSTQANPSHTYTVPGYYDITLTVTTNDACAGSYSLTLDSLILMQDAPTAALSANQTTITGVNPQVTITDISQGSDSVIYNISTGDIIYDADFTYLFQDTGYYTIEQIAFTQAGCRDTASLQVYVEPYFMFYSPNAFTPNGDQNNDAFIQKGIGVKTYYLEIYNRWGEKVFTTEDIEEGWNGYEQDGKKAKQDVYAYKTIIVDVFGETHTYSGEVYLIR